jgi:hypothetical protein
MVHFQDLALSDIRQEKNDAKSRNRLSLVPAPVKTTTCACVRRACIIEEQRLPHLVQPQRRKEQALSAASKLCQGQRLARNERHIFSPSCRNAREKGWRYSSLCTLPTAFVCVVPSLSPIHPMAQNQLVLNVVQIRFSHGHGEDRGELIMIYRYSLYHAGRSRKWINIANLVIFHIP